MDKDKYSEITLEDLINKPSKELVKSFITETMKLAKKHNLEVFIVSEGASGYSYYGRNDFVKKHRDYQIKLEKNIGADPDEDWSKK